MSPRERVLSVLRGEMPDVVPWFGDLDYWVSSLREKGELAPGYAGDGYYTLHRELGVGFYLQGDFPWTGRTPGESVEEKRVGNARRRTWRNPAGTLTEEETWLPGTFSWAHTKYLVTGPRDIPAFLWHVRHTEVAPDYRATLHRRGLLGDNGILLAYLPRSPFMDLVTGLCGLQTLVFLLVDSPDETAELLAAMEKLSDTAADIALRSPAECLMSPENLSSEMVGEKLYLAWMRPYEARWIERIRAAGRYSFIHMDGTLRGLVARVAETGFDVLEALTPVPSGDMSMREIAAAVPGGTVVWGGLPGIIFTPLVSEESFERHVIETLEVMKERPRCVLGVADQVPPNGTRERIARVAELVERHGRIHR
jgi:hypothetical protein